jgi:gluconolactonase
VRFLALLLVCGVSLPGFGQVPDGAPLATIDLMTREGVSLVEGQWRYSDVEITQVDFRAAGPEGQPTGPRNRAYDLEPHAGAAGFDDSQWQVLEPETLNTRRSAGRVAFNWYRIGLTVPEQVEGFDPTGSTVVFETSVDDYAEIWVDGELPRLFGQQGGSVVSGWNASNRLVIGRNVRPGQQIQLAIFGINGPISDAPTNYIYLRRARLEFHVGGWEPRAVEPQEVNIEVLRIDPEMDTIVPPNPKLFKLAEGFTFTEGPLWVPQDGGYLLFSDPNENRIYRYTAAGQLSIFRTPSGYSGADIAEYGQPGSNGLTLDPQGRITVSEHGNHRVSRLEADGTVTVLASTYQGRRLNSPNDLVYRSDGTLYFTDPPFGLPEFHGDPRRELPWSGIYRLLGDRLKLVSKELSGPNGIALSPDEKTLYVGNWDPQAKVILRFPLAEDGSAGSGEVFFDMTGAPFEEGIDGIKVDQAGNIYVSGPGGIWVLSADGRHLGTLIPPHPAHNFAWGGEDGKTLYITAQNTLYRMPLRIPGVRP